MHTLPFNANNIYSLSTLLWSFYLYWRALFAVQSCSQCSIVLWPTDTQSLIAELCVKPLKPSPTSELPSVWALQLGAAARQLSACCGWRSVNHTSNHCCRLFEAHNSFSCLFQHPPHTRHALITDRHQHQLARLFWVCLALCRPLCTWLNKRQELCCWPVSTGQGFPLCSSLQLLDNIPGDSDECSMAHWAVTLRFSDHFSVIIKNVQLGRALMQTVLGDSQTELASNSTSDCAVCFPMCKCFTICHWEHVCMLLHCTPHPKRMSALE